jgi:pyruvate,water dikinase
MVMRGEAARDLAAAYASLSDNGARRLIVRSSSTSEDGSTSSMAGMFESIGGVTDWKSFVRAVDRVLLSARRGLEPGVAASPMAVLVQPELDAQVGGIMFGVDPLTGRSDRLLVVAAAAGPQKLVTGEDEGIEYVLAPSGRALRKPPAGASILSPRRRRALASLASRAAKSFGAPQDIEWAFEDDGALVMFQSRPVTAVAAVGAGPILGPGPVAETFPDALAPLEVDLWVEPMRTAIAEALRITGAASHRKIASSAVVATIGGRVAADLDLLGASPKKRTLWQRLDPRPPARRLSAAWRVGRLRAAVGPLARRLVTTIDGHLSQVPDPSELTNEQLLNVLLRAQRALVSLHGYEVLSGMLDAEVDEDGATGAGIALRALALGRAEGFDDARLMEVSPEVLALTPPSIDGRGALPASVRGVEIDGPVELGPREALKLRIRWVQELSARCARELGRRLVPAGQLDAPEQVSHLSLRELEDLIAGGEEPAGLSERVTLAPPLPAAFRLSDAGVVVAIESERGAGKGAGGGRGMGRVHRGLTPQHGDVLVVQSLDPGLAHLLPSLGGLVAETGNVLSHLAILAREFGVPTVVGMAGARETFADGAVVVVDGASGEVFEVEES